MRSIESIVCYEPGPAYWVATIISPPNYLIGDKYCSGNIIVTISVNISHMDRSSTGFISTDYLFCPLYRITAVIMPPSDFSCIAHSRCENVLITVTVKVTYINFMWLVNTRGDNIFGPDSGITTLIFVVDYLAPVGRNCNNIRLIIPENICNKYTQAYPGITINRLFGPGNWISPLIYP